MWDSFPNTPEGTEAVHAVKLEQREPCQSQRCARGHDKKHSCIELGLFLAKRNSSTTFAWLDPDGSLFMQKDGTMSSEGPKHYMPLRSGLYHLGHELLNLRACLAASYSSLSQGKLRAVLPTSDPASCLQVRICLFLITDLIPPVASGVASGLAYIQNSHPLRQRLARPPHRVGPCHPQPDHRAHVTLGSSRQS